MTIDKQLEELRTQIHYHDYLYYVTNHPEISDNVYDELLQKLIQLEAKHTNLITNDSPTQRVSGTIQTGFKSIDHKTALLSLGNAFTEKDLYDWYNKTTALIGVPNPKLVCELKFDGLAISILYENGILISGATRGNGIQGEDVTQNIRTIKSIPLKLRKRHSNLIDVRGEILFPKSKFQQLNEDRIEKGLTPYSHPRNTASGSLRQLNPNITAQRNLDIFFYNIGYIDGYNITSHWEQLDYLKELGLKTNPLNKRVNSIEEIIDFYSIWNNNQNNLDYCCDGIVIKIDDLDYQQKIGANNRQPKWAIAYKFPSIQATTLLKKIDVNVGRSGVLTPYATLEPIEIDGVIIKHATLHNIEYIQKKDLRIGDQVVVERAGNVIPQIISPLTNKRKGNETSYKMPHECPSCMRETIKEDPFVLCINAQCPAQLTRLIEHFASKNSMDIEGLGIKQINSLVQKKKVKDISDLYILDFDDLLDIDRFGEKSASNLIQSIQNSKQQPFYRVLTGLGIPNVGNKTAEILCKTFTTINDLKEAPVETLNSIPSIGITIATSINNFLNNPMNCEMIDRLKDSGLIFYSNSTFEKNTTFNNITFAITGKFSSFSRSEIENIITDNGGTTTRNITKKTNFLILGDSPGSKLDHAKTLGISLITEKEFKSMIDTKTP